MRNLRLMLLLSLLLLATTLIRPARAQAPDADGDGVPDSGDYCWLAPGTAEYHGCTAATFPDFDHDGVGDPDDTCIDQAGSADNSGCPQGVIPDLDLDGVPDSADACPREAGTENGCPPDADTDGIPDASDACPQQAGGGSNLGCPDGVTPSDTDGDTIPDLLDACRSDAGSPDLGGCPDRDGDGVPDSYDTCPDQAGQSDLFGCAPVTTTTIPSAPSLISAANAGSVHETGRLVVGIPRFGVSATTHTLALRSSDDLLTYDLSSATLAPTITINTGWSGYPVAVSSDARYLATLEFPPDFSTPPFVQVRDGNTGAPSYRIESQAGSAGLTLGISAFAFNPALPLLAIAETSGGGFTDGIGTPVILWDVANNRSAGTLNSPNIVINIGFSGDGTKLATDSADGSSMIVTLWDVGSQAEITHFETTPIFHFMGTPLALNGDGSTIVVGYPDGSFSLWQVSGTSAAPQYSVPIFDASKSEVVSAVSFSPDGSVVAVAGGVPFSGGLSGSERFPIFLIDAATGATLAQLDGHDSLIRDMAFSADGRFLISAGDSSIKFWSVG